MKRPMYHYTKKVLESVSFDSILFRKELEKAIKWLLPYEIEELRRWLVLFTKKKPELQNCLLLIQI